ncbi:9846_t:CDS:2, partial [Dentiscutata heterogama]
MSDNIPPTLYVVRTDDESNCFILKLAENNYWLIDSAPARFRCYQYFKFAILKRKITNFKGITITNPRKEHLEGMTRFFKEYILSKSIHAKEFPNLDFYVVLTEKFRNEEIIDILKDIGFELDNNVPKKFEYSNITMEYFFHKNGKPLILRHKKSDKHDMNAVGNNDNVTLMRNKAKVQTDLSSILTYLQYENNEIKKSMLLTSDNVVTWIQKILATKLNIYQQAKLNKRPFIDIFQVPNHGARFNSMIAGPNVNPPKYVNQQFALMAILYYGGQFDFKDLNNKTNIDIEADFEIILNFTNFETFKKAALLQEYTQSHSNPNAIKRFLKAMAKALIIQGSSKKTNNVNWDWDEINWPEVARKLYIIYCMNQTTDSHCWPKYDFIKDIIDIPDKDNIDPYFNHPYFDKTTRKKIIEKQLYSYFNSIKERIYENFDIIISIKNKKKKRNRRPQYATHLRPLLIPMWNSLDTSPLMFRNIVFSISNFYESFITGTYIISSGAQKGHPDPLVIIGIIKSILEDLNEERSARILLTSGSKINMNLISSAVDSLLGYKEKKSCYIDKFLNRRIKIYSIRDSSCEVGVKLSDSEFEDPKSVRLLKWNNSEKAEIKKISDTFKTIPEQPINKISKSYIKILINDKKLWLGVNEKGDLIPSDKPILFTISNVPFLDQIAYRISSCDFNFIVKFEWAIKDEYNKFYLVDLNTDQDLYYALEYDVDDDFYLVDKSTIDDFEESTPLPHFRKIPLKEKENALLFNFSKSLRDNFTNQSTKKRKSGKTLSSYLMELGEHSALSGLTILNALNYIIRASNVKKVFKSLPDKCLLFKAKSDSEVEWEITENNLFKIKNAIIRLDESELLKFHTSFPFYKHATAMQVNIKNPQLDNLQIEIKIFLNNNGSKSESVLTPEIFDISQSKSVYDYLLNANVPQKKWKDLRLSYLSSLIMPSLILVPEFLKVPLPFLSGTSLLNQKINKEISDINFEIGPTGARLIRTEVFLDILTIEDIFQLDGIQISQLTDIKITTINSDAVNGDPNITIEACANIKDNAVKILTQNEDEQFLLVKFNTNKLVNIAEALNVGENVFNKFKVPLYDVSLDKFLNKVNPEFSLLFHPVTEPPTMNFKLKNISIFVNNFLTVEKFVPPQICRHLKLTNASIDISIYDPLNIDQLDIENIMIGLNIKLNLLTTDNKNLLANLSYLTVKQAMSISIRPQDLYDDNNPLNLKELLKAIELYDTFEKISKFSLVLWHHVKDLESVGFQYLDLQIKLNEQGTTYEIGDFNLGILIPRFIIKKDVIEVRNAIVDLGYNSDQWSGKIQGVGEIIGKDRKNNCHIEYMLPTKEQLGNLLINDITEDLSLKEALQILQLENTSILPALEKFFEHMKISEININLVNSDRSDFIINDLSFILQKDKHVLKPLTIKQLEVNLTYFPPKNNTDSAIWKFSFEGSVSTMIMTLNYNNEKIHAALTPVKNTRLKDVIELLVKTPEFSDNSMYYEIFDSEITDVKITIDISGDNMHIEKFSTKLVKILSYGEFTLDDLLFKCENVNMDKHDNNQIILPHKKYTLDAIISRNIANDKVSAKIKLDCSENIVDASITSFQSHFLLLDILKILIGYESNLPNLLPKLPNFPNFDNIESDQKFSVKILIKPFKIMGFNISAQSESFYEVLKKPSIYLQPLGISISYMYDCDSQKENLEGRLYGIFILNDGSKLKLEFASSMTKDSDIVIAGIQVFEGESSIHISTVVDTLLDDNYEWPGKTPKEMRSPKFTITPEVKAYLHINLVKKSVALYATIESIGNCLLLVKNMNEKPSTGVVMESHSIANEFGYLFALRTSNNFQFEDLFNLSDVVYNIDTMLSLLQGNLILVSFQGAQFEKAKKELNDIIKEFNDVLNPDKQIKFEDILSIKLPDHDIYKNEKLVKGANLYVNLNYHSILLKNLRTISNLDSSSQKILVALSLGVGALSESEFKATIEDLTLYGGLSFESTSFYYKPKIKESESRLIVAGNLNFTELLKTKFIVKGILDNGEKVSSFTADSKFLESQSIKNPFEKMIGICLYGIEFTMKLIRENNKKNPSSTCLLKGKVDFNSENQNMKTILEGNVLFVDGKPRICTVTINKKIQFIHLLATIFFEKSQDEKPNWNQEYPDIILNDGEIYYTFIPPKHKEDKIEIDGKVYYKGYNISAHIDFFGMNNLLITAQINNGIIIKADSGNSEINLGFVKIIKYNLIIESNSKSKSISIDGSLKLFDMNPAQFHLDYKKKSKCLEGKIEIKGSLLGVDDPAIEGYWSKKKKFVITKWPSFCQLFWEATEFARIIEEASVNLCKAIISDLNLKEKFEGHFNIDLEQLETHSDALVSFLITGSYLIRIKGGKEELTEITKIDILPIQLDIKYPSDISKYFEEELPKNAVKFLQNLLNDPEKFVKFLGGLSIATLINLSEPALKGLVCFAGNEIFKLAKVTFDAMKKSANNILRNRQPKSKPSEEMIKAVEKAITLSDAVVLASPLLLITGEWVVFFAFAITLITVDLKILYGDQSEEERKIRKEKNEMKLIDKRIKGVLERFLKMDNLTPGLEFCLDNSLKIKWNVPEDAENDKLAGEICYKLQITIFGKELVERNFIVIVGKEEIEMDKLDHKRLSYVFIDNLLMKCEKVSVKITAILRQGNQNYTGSQSKEAEIEHKPKLYPPTKLTSTYDSRHKILTTKIVSEDKDTQQYYCELFNVSANKGDSFEYKEVVYSEVIDINTLDLENTLWKIYTEERLILGLGGNYKIRVSAKAINWIESEFTYANEVIARLSPPISIGFKHTYDIYEYLEIIIKDTIDQKQLRGYTCDVINDKDESNLMNSSYTLSSKSFKFLPHVNNINGSYNIDNNILKISWDLVENASLYEVFLLAHGQRLKLDRISETFIEYDIQQFDKQITKKQISNSDCQITIYNCTIQAKKGKEFFDGPVTRIDKGFEQLPRPTNVDMEKNSNKLHISYTPITLSD